MLERSSSRRRNVNSNNNCRSIRNNNNSSSYTSRNIKKLATIYIYNSKTTALNSCKTGIQTFNNEMKIRNYNVKIYFNDGSSLMPLQLIAFLSNFYRHPRWGYGLLAQRTALIESVLNSCLCYEKPPGI